MPTRKQHIAGGLMGLLVGDALGVPYEFHESEEIPEPQEIEFTPPFGFDRSHGSVPPGTYSDDGALALCLLDSLLEQGRFDADDFGQRMVRWYSKGYLAVDGSVFDVGTTTAFGIEAIKSGIPPLWAGPRGVHDCGNGALMRVLPLALWHQGSDEQLVQDAQDQSCLTHGHLRSQVCCALYVLWARRILDEVQNPWQNAVATLREIYGKDPEEPAATEMEQNIRPDERASGEGSGYVVDCLNSARWSVTQGNYEQIVRAAIGLGHDTDTTACVAGGIAGLRDGMDAIPERWVQALRGQDLWQPLLDRLLTLG